MQHRSWRGKEGVPGVLYHPHFEPSLSWLRTSLLVYDNVLSIVPREAGYALCEGQGIQRHPLPLAPPIPAEKRNSLLCGGAEVSTLG